MFAALVSSILLVSQTADGDPPPDIAEAERLEAEQADAETRAQQATEEADSLASEIAELQQRLITAGRQAASSEREALDAEREIERLNAEEALILQRLEDNQDSLIDVLAALQRIETQAPPALLAAPHDAADAARAASLLSELTPALRERAAELADMLDNLQAVRDAALAQHETLAGAETDLAHQRETIQSLIAQRRELETRRRGEAAELTQQANRAASRALSIRSLLGELRRAADISPTINPRRLDRTDTIPEPRMRPTRNLVSARAAPAPLATLRFADARGQLTMPATGDIVRGFGDRDTDGVPSEGIFIRPRPGAQVVSPFDARVEFAGPFGSYRGLLILNVGDNYYIVLAGMAVTFASAGQSVLAGEPIGAMPENGQPAPDLYLELRRGDNAVDPRPWLRTGPARG